MELGDQRTVVTPICLARARWKTKAVHLQKHAPQSPHDTLPPLAALPLPAAANVDDAADAGNFAFAGVANCRLGTFAFAGVATCRPGTGLGHFFDPAVVGKGRKLLVFAEGPELSSTDHGCRDAGPTTTLSPGDRTIQPP